MWPTEKGSTRLARSCRVGQRLFIAAAQVTLLVMSRAFRWPVDLNPVDLEPLLDPLTLDDQKTDLSAKRPPLSRTTARRIMELAYAE